ncbi:MAG: hypothetical protein M1541_00430 [Acidobacteria bacterium]|nr:hypothetical protein [Acidobacteriota bacterium]
MKWLAPEATSVRPGITPAEKRDIGEGQFKTPEERYRALKFVMDTGAVDAVTIGYKSAAEVDEAIERMNRVLNS